MWDLSLLGIVPGIRVAAPRDETRLRQALRESVAISDGPTVLRYPKTPVPDDIDPVRAVGTVDVLWESPHSGGLHLDSDQRSDVLVVAVGATATAALEAAERVGAEGIAATVADPRWVKPLDAGLVELARAHRLVVTVEDGGRSGGVGSSVAQLLRDAEVDVPVRDVALPQEFLPVGKAAALAGEFGLTGQAIARRVVEWVSRLSQDEVSSRSGVS